MRGAIRDGRQSCVVRLGLRGGGSLTAVGTVLGGRAIDLRWTDPDAWERGGPLGTPNADVTADGELRLR